MTTIPPRPEADAAMIHKAAAVIGKKLDDDHELVAGRAAAIADVYQEGLNGYELARELDHTHGWFVTPRMVEILDDMDYEVDRLLDQARRQWAQQQRIIPGLDIGTLIGQGKITGHTQNTDLHPASYLVEDDATTRQWGPGSRQIIPFEAATPLLQPVPVERDGGGAWWHPALPDFDESATIAEFRGWLAVRGIDTAWSGLDHDGTDVERAAYQRGASLHCWQPAPPAGEGWFLLALYDTEEGPQCVWGNLSRFGLHRGDSPHDQSA